MSKNAEFRLISLDELLKEPMPSNRELAAELARYADEILDSPNGPVDSATWRLATG